MNPYAANTYKTQEIQTASQEQILLMLYDGAIRFLNVAKQGLAEKNIEKFHNNLMRAQRIIMEFMTSLDFEIGGEVAQNLFHLYEYLHYRLVQANIKKDETMIDEVLTHLKELRATWEEAIRLTKQDLADPSSATNQENHVYSA